MTYFTNKLKNDLEFIKEVNVTEEDGIKKIIKNNKEFFLKKTNILSFFKTFYLKDLILFILVFAFSFIFGKYTIFISAVILIIYAYVIIENKNYLKYLKYIKTVITLSFIISIILLIISLFYEKYFNLAVNFFYTSYLLYGFNFFTIIYSQFKNKSFYFIQGSDNENLLKGYLVWQE